MKIIVKRNIFSLIVALAIAYLSLTDPAKFNHLSISRFHNIDKAVHFAMYFTLMSAIGYENKAYLHSRIRLLVIALIPFFYGAVMEILQSLFTTYRTGSIFDFLFDLAGIMASVGLFIIFRAKSGHKAGRTGITADPE